MIEHNATSENVSCGCDMDWKEFFITEAGVGLAQDSAYLIERSVIESSRTPIVRLGSEIELTINLVNRAQSNVRLPVIYSIAKHCHNEFDIFCTFF